ncbi:three component ABC system middle component [Pseudotabrizicola sp. L79]|jgi:hypothetical protein|uniref:three component ABC system middle component n=1 Tax=Pseudotabrizicola sp. L79 TaxID=3118402 RepID=UPI002F92A242
MTLERGNYYLSEIERVQNPSLGAMLIWKYGRSFQAHITAEPPDLLLAFLVLPLCLHRPTLDIIVGTQARSGLGKFCEKLSERREELFAVHERCVALKRLSLNSLAFGERAGILAIEYETARMRAIPVADPPLSERVKAQAKGAERLGIWFSALKTSEVFHALKVVA